MGRLGLQQWICVDTPNWWTFTVYATPPQPNPAPLPTTSRYVSTLDPGTMNTEGQAEGQLGIYSLVILDFGQPQCSGQASPYGTFLFGSGGEVSNGQIITAVEQWLDGYSFGSNYGQRGNVTVVVGTNNDAGQIGCVTSGHGQAWAQVVSFLQQYANSRGYSSFEFVYGGSDVEPGFGSASATLSWVQGYDSTGGYYYDYGSCDGCPQTLPSCNTLGCYPLGNGWFLDTIIYITREDSHSLAPVPEIYYDGSSLCPQPLGPPCSNSALQWQIANLWEQTNRSSFGSIIFSGSLTQYGAGVYNHTQNTTYTPDEGWMALSNALSPRQSLIYSTDITYAQ
ncbi:MAG: hypothetical protein ACR2PL_10825 [Dehalococcoidia bacterium]